MKSNGRLERFITLILLLGLPKNQAVACNNTHIQPALPDFLPLTRFLRATLDRVRVRELSKARNPVEGELLFRIGFSSGKYEAQSTRANHR